MPSSAASSSKATHGCEKSSKPPLDRVPHRIDHADAGQGCGRPLACQLQAGELADEQRIASGPDAHRGGHRDRRRLPGQCGHQPSHIDRCEPFERHDLGGTRDTSQRIPGFDIAIGPGEQHSSIPELASSELEQPQGCVVCTMQILEDEHDRLLLGDTADKPYHAVEKTKARASRQLARGVEQQLLRVSTPVPSEKRSRRPGWPARACLEGASQQLRPRPERGHSLTLGAPPPERKGSTRHRPSGDFADDSSLADPRVTGHQYQLGST